MIKREMKRLMACIGVLLAVMLSAEAQTYVNPILGGDYPDPTIMREGKDYYMTHSAFDYQPRDLRCGIVGTW